MEFSNIVSHVSSLLRVSYSSGRLVPAIDAPKYIGHVNPGIGYWWQQVDGHWYLWLTPEQVPSDFTIAIHCLPGAVAIAAFWIMLSEVRCYLRRKNGGSL